MTLADAEAPGLEDAPAAPVFPPRPGIWPAVVFTHCIPAVRSATGEWHSWQLLTSADLDGERIDQLLEGVIRRAREHVAQAQHAAWFDLSSPRPSRVDCPLSPGERSSAQSGSPA